MVSVTATKIRDNTRDRASSLALGRAYTGYLISYPSIGRGMVIFRDPNGHRMVTTPVRRVLGDDAEEGFRGRQPRAGPVRIDGGEDEVGVLAVPVEADAPEVGFRQMSGVLPVGYPHGYPQPFRCGGAHITLAACAAR